MTDIDSATLLLPVIPESPKEWEVKDEALIEQASEEHPTIPDTITDRAWAARVELASRRWFLVRNEVGNEPARSQETGRKETYFQTLGVDRPWHGLNDLYAWLRQELDPQHLNPFIERDVVELVGEWVALGRVEAISEEQAYELSMEIYLKSRGRYDIMAKARERMQRESHAPNRPLRVQRQDVSQRRYV